jgi:hypothetical protein
VHANTAPLQFHAQFVERQLAALGHAATHEVGVIGKLAEAQPVALPTRLKRTSLGPKFHEIIHKLGRNPEMTRRLPVAVPLIHKRTNTQTQCHR